MPRPLLWLALLLPLWGCSSPSKPELIGYLPPLPVRIEETGLLRLANGNAFLVAVPGAALQYDPTLRDPLTALAACSQWVLGCFQPGARTLDACMSAVPACTSATPWLEAAPCCPAACKSRYLEERESTTDPYTALDAVLFQDGACLPGVNALLGRP